MISVIWDGRVNGKRPGLRIIILATDRMFSIDIQTKGNIYRSTTSTERGNFKQIAGSGKGRDIDERREQGDNGVLKYPFKHNWIPSIN